MTAKQRSCDSGLTHPRAGRVPAPGVHRQPRQHDHCHQPRIPLALPRPPGRPAVPPPPGCPHSWAGPVSRPLPPAAPPSGSSCPRCPPPSPPALWATTTKPPPVSSARPAVYGADTPPEITQGHYHARPQPQLAAVDYASPPGSHPGSLRGYRVACLPGRARLAGRLCSGPRQRRAGTDGQVPAPGELPACPPRHGPGTRRLIHQFPGQRRPGRTPLK